MFQMTVIELNEWIPYEQFEMKQDEITDTHLGVVQVKLPNSALGHHGILIRLEDIYNQNFCVKFLNNLFS